MTLTRPRWLVKTARQRSRVCLFARNSLCCVDQSVLPVCVGEKRRCSEVVFRFFRCSFSGSSSWMLPQQPQKMPGRWWRTTWPKNAKSYSKRSWRSKSFSSFRVNDGEHSFYPVTPKHEICDMLLFFLLIASCDWALSFSVCRFQTGDGEVKYVQEAEELIRPERNTLLVSFTDLEGFNQELATTIQEEYYRWANHGKAWASYVDANIKWLYLLDIPFLFAICMWKRYFFSMC